MTSLRSLFVIACLSINLRVWWRVTCSTMRHLETLR